MTRTHACIRPPLLLFLTAILVGTLTACTPSDRFVAGRPLDSEELGAIADSLLADTEAIPETYDPYRPTPYPEGTVFWVSGSPVWHTDPRCRHLLRSDWYFHGTSEEAAAAGKTRACPACETEGAE